MKEKAIQETGVDMVKEGEQGRCPVTQYRMPPIIWGLHFLEILALILLTFHTLVHGHAIFNYLKKTWLKRKQEQAQAFSFRNVYSDLCTLNSHLIIDKVRCSW